MRITSLTMFSKKADPPDERANTSDFLPHTPLLDSHTNSLSIILSDSEFWSEMKRDVGKLGGGGRGWRKKEKKFSNQGRRAIQSQFSLLLRNVHESMNGRVEGAISMLIHQFRYNFIQIGVDTFFFFLKKVEKVTR